MGAFLFETYTPCGQQSAGHECSSTEWLHFSQKALTQTWNMQVMRQDDVRQTICVLTQTT